MVEIILATYNGEKYLREQLESILSQSITEFKVLIRDDGSTDETHSIITEYEKKDKRIHIIEDKKGNLGYVNNFFELLSYTRCEYVLFSDQDDVWQRDKIGKMLKVAYFELQLVGEKIPLLVHHDVTLTEENLKEKGLLIKRKGVKEGIQNFFFQNIVQSAAMMINRPLIELLKKRPQEIKYHDKYMHYIVELFGKRSFIPESLMYYRQHGKNSVGQESNQNKIERFAENKGQIFLSWEREALIFILKNFKVDEENRVKISQYLYITDVKIPKKERMKILKRSLISISFKKMLAMKWLGK